MCVCVCVSVCVCVCVCVCVYFFKTSSVYFLFRHWNIKLNLKNHTKYTFNEHLYKFTD